MEEGAMDLVECGFNRQHAKLFLLAARRMDKREGAAHRGMGLAVTAAHHQRIGAIGGLAYLDEAYGRQAQNPLDLQLDLSSVQVPEASAEALQIAPLDLGHPTLDRPDVVSIV